MIAVVAPEPAAWLQPLLARLEGPVQVLAPWALPAVGRALPGRLGRAWGRRIAPAPASPLRGFPLVEAAVRMWAGGRTDRQIRARLALRLAVGRWAARCLPAQAHTVVAAGLSALEVLARARADGKRTVLVQDLPLLRPLHDDLDRAARRHPDCRFLRRYRADRGTLVRQEQEHALADEILVRGHYAAAALGRAGVPVSVLGALTAVPGAGDGDAIRLAGPATARGGVMEALSALDRLPDLTLEVRPSDGMEPQDLLARPRVRRAGGDVEGLRAVIAPAWCESYAPEVVEAARRGTPLICTPAGAGPVTGARLVAPGDVSGLVAALRQISL